VTSKASKASTLLIHDGELDDVRALLQELGAAFEERSERPTRADQQASWSLVIATPMRMLEFVDHDGENAPTRIAILAGEARMLRKLMQREKIEFVVRRPVHPAALRLLIAHALYRGPEKREVSRVSIGAPVRLRIGWLWRRAILVDLSVRGCRLQSKQRVRRGDRLAIRLPAKVAGRRPLSLRGRVVRRRPADRAEPGVDIIAVHFDPPAFETARRLQAAVNGHAEGPAAVHHATARRYAIEGRAGAATGVTDPADPDGPAEPTAEVSTDRARGVRGDRRSFSRRVIALGDEFTRVLIGRDISVGGMRVDPNPRLAPGDLLQIAVHSKPGELPLVVRAEVCRDDGELGLALQFRDLAPEAKAYLRTMVASLPAIEAPAVIRDDAVGVVVSEILDAEGP
jgi:hypothetical protein